MSALLSLMLKRLRGNGLFGLAVIVSLGLGIGACTSVFAVVKATLFPVMPYPDPGRVVQIWSTQTPRSAQRFDAVPPERMRLWLAQPFSSLEGFSARTTLSLVTAGDTPERIS